MRKPLKDLDPQFLTIALPYVGSRRKILDRSALARRGSSDLAGETVEVSAVISRLPGEWV
jgi:hypothetical protein